MSKHPMKAICVTTTRMPADLLRIALRQRGLQSEQLGIHWSAGDGLLAPKAILLQAGGVRALEMMGLQLDRLPGVGPAVRKVLILDARGDPLILYDTSIASPRWCPRWILTDAIRRQLALASGSPELQREPVPMVPSWCRYSVSTSKGWTSLSCPGTLVRVLDGALTSQDTHLVWDGRHAFVGIGQISDQQLLMFAVPKGTRTTIVQQQAQALEALNETPTTLHPYLRVHNQPYQDTWFPVRSIGYRRCWDGHALRWGPAALRLHPLTGQHLSYWAIEANWLADKLAHHGELSHALLAALDRQHRRFFRQHLNTLNFYLRPTLFWKAIYRPYAWALRHSRLLRSRALMRVSLLADSADHSGSPASSPWLGK